MSTGSSPPTASYFSRRSCLFQNRCSVTVWAPSWAEILRQTDNTPVVEAGRETAALDLARGGILNKEPARILIKIPFRIREIGGARRSRCEDTG